MILDLKHIFEAVGATIPFAFLMDLADEKVNETGSFISPVQIKGCVENRAGIVSLRYDVTFDVQTPCDRCLEPVSRQFHNTFDHILRQGSQGQRSDDILVDRASLDVAALVRSDILLSLPYKFLCDQECKGLCAYCGVNCNQVACDCEQHCGKIPDPRLSGLGDALD